jgi:hypothetical protein
VEVAKPAVLVASGPTRALARARCTWPALPRTRPLAEGGGAAATRWSVGNSALAEGWGATLPWRVSPPPAMPVRVALRITCQARATAAEAALSRKRALSPRQNIQVWKDDVYSLDNLGSSSYLARMAVTGGPWIRLPKPQSGFADQLQIVGSSFFDSLRSQAGHAFVVGSLGDPASARVPFTVAGNGVAAWVGTAQGIFWTGGRVIRRRFDAQ